MGILTISGSPHIHDRSTVPDIMWGVVYALIPAFLVSIWYFGLNALILTLIAAAACMLFEFMIQKFIMKQEPSITDGSAALTGILLAFNVPSSLPVWQLLIGCFVSIGIAKLAYGGLGKNIFNPALVGRVFLLISFPVDMTLWPVPKPMTVLWDGLSGPTTLGILKEGLLKGDSAADISMQFNNLDIFLGNTAGSLGEVSSLALILGGIYLIYRKIISWHIPVSYLLSVFVFAGIMYLIDPENYINPLIHLIAGGLILGAIFMATDMVTSPMSTGGMLVYGTGCGVLTVLIRLWGAYPEGVSFAILIMNAFTPLINQGFKPKRFGEIIKYGK